MPARTFPGTVGVLGLGAGLVQFAECGVAMIAQLLDLAAQPSGLVGGAITVGDRLVLIDGGLFGRVPINSRLRSAAKQHQRHTRAHPPHRPVTKRLITHRDVPLGSRPAPFRWQ